jgi:dienelactone hydrolase
MGPSTRCESGLITDTARARQLFVSNRPEDHRQANFEQQIQQRAVAESTTVAKSRGVLEYTNVKYKSSVDGMEIPASLYQPLQKRGPRGHAAMVWVHGGVHGSWWSYRLFPFVKEAIQRGYVIIAPEYRGSTGFGAAHYNAIDYGARTDDVALSSRVPEDALARGSGPIASWAESRRLHRARCCSGEHRLFKAGGRCDAGLEPRSGSDKADRAYQVVPDQKGPGAPYEKKALYIERSPLYQVEKLKVPILVHVATNDTDVDYVEDQQLVWKLRALKPDLAETKVYVDPAPGPSSVGHTFNRRVNPTTWERDDSPDQIDSWNRTWTFFDWWLRPYEDRSKAKM